MKNVIIAPTFQVGVGLAQKRGIDVYDGDTVIVSNPASLKSRDLRYCNVYMLSSSWGVRPGGYDLAMRLEQEAKTRGANIEWVS